MEPCGSGNSTAILLMAGAGVGCMFVRAMISCDWMAGGGCLIGVAWTTGRASARGLGMH